MSKLKFDIGGIVKNVKGALDPETNLPPDEEKNPLGYRAARLRELVKGIEEKQESIADEYNKMVTNLDEVVAELQKLAKEKEAELAKEKPAEDKAEDKKDDKKEDDKKEAEEKEDDK